MARLRLKGQSPPATDGPAQAVTPAPFSLQITGVVVTRAQLMAALRPFVPGLTDIQPFEDGERFFLVLKAEPGPDSPTNPTP